MSTGAAAPPYPPCDARERQRPRERPPRRWRASCRRLASRRGTRLTASRRPRGLLRACRRDYRSSAMRIQQSRPTLGEASACSVLVEEETDDAQERRRRRQGRRGRRTLGGRCPCSCREKLPLPGPRTSRVARTGEAAPDPVLDLASAGALVVSVPNSVAGAFPGRGDRAAMPRPRRRQRRTRGRVDDRRTGTSG